MFVFPPPHRSKRGRQFISGLIKRQTTMHHHIYTYRQFRVSKGPKE